MWYNFRYWIKKYLLDVFCMLNDYTYVHDGIGVYKRYYCFACRDDHEYVAANEVNLGAPNDLEKSDSGANNDGASFNPSINNLGASGVVGVVGAGSSSGGGSGSRPFFMKGISSLKGFTKQAGRGFSIFHKQHSDEV